MPSAVVNADPRAKNVSSVVWWSSTGLEFGQSLNASCWFTVSGGHCLEGNAGGNRGVLYKSPLHRTRKLQPACFASACSMWSRKPMPVSISTCCEAEDCEACVFFVSVLLEPKGGGGKCGEEGRAESSPPSRERETWIFVSLVSRSMRAVRAEGGCEEPIVRVCC